MSEYAVWVRAAALYLPITAALLAFLLRARHPKQFAGCLLSVLWVMTWLPVVQRLNQAAGWWSFAAGGIQFCGMPVELYLGWMVLWGLAPELAFSEAPIGWVAAGMAGLDWFGMPKGMGVVSLRPWWLAGEAVAVGIVLLPALCLARWTIKESHLRTRAAMQVAIAGLLFLYLVPQLVFAVRPSRAWEPLAAMGSVPRQLAFQTICLLALPGLAAVMEFAERGLGTPIPYDPPKRLVTSGIYRYCANPMQMSCALVMLAWAAILWNGWLVLAALVAAVYSAGIAAWDEEKDLKQRFGADWLAYRAEVSNWRPRWRPYHAGTPAHLYIARNCGPCSELRAWLESRAPVGLEIVDAETLAPGTIRRMRYDPQDGSAEIDGVRALGRALEHINLPWALGAAMLRLPLVWQAVQLVMDASGLGPRTVGNEG